MTILLGEWGGWGARGGVGARGEGGVEDRWGPAVCQVLASCQYRVFPGRTNNPSQRCPGNTLHGSSASHFSANNTHCSGQTGIVWYMHWYTINEPSNRFSEQIFVVVVFPFFFLLLLLLFFFSSFFLSFLFLNITGDAFHTAVNIFPLCSSFFSISTSAYSILIWFLVHRLVPSLSDY